MLLTLAKRIFRAKKIYTKLNKREEKKCSTFNKINLFDLKRMMEKRKE